MILYILGQRFLLSLSGDNETFTEQVWNVLLSISSKRKREEIWYWELIMKRNGTSYVFWNPYVNKWQ